MAEPPAAPGYIFPNDSPPPFCASCGLLPGAEGDLLALLHSKRCVLGCHPFQIGLGHDLQRHGRLSKGFLEMNEAGFWACIERNLGNADAVAAELKSLPATEKM